MKDMNAADYITALAAIISIIGAIITWLKERGLSKKIVENQFKLAIGKLEKDFSDLLDLSIKYWCNSDISKGDRSCIGKQIKSKNKDVSINITNTYKSFPGLFSDGSKTELIEEFNSFDKKITGGSFESTDFQIDSSKTDLIISESSSIKKLIISIKNNNL